MIRWLGVMAGLAGVLVIENLGAPLLNDLLLTLPGADKVLHFGQSLAVFAVLFWLLGRAGLSWSTRVLTAAGGALGMAVADELQQLWRGDRHVELADIAAGASGAAVGAAWHGRLLRPAASTAVIAVACAVAGGLTYDSYRHTRDYNRGILADRRGERAEALGHYLDAIRAGVQDPEVYNAAAWALAESATGDPAMAVDLAGRSLAMRPGNADTLDTYGWALFKAGRAGEAVPPLEEALAAKPDIYCIHYHLGMAYLVTGRVDEARRHLRLQVERRPDTGEAALAAAQLATMPEAGSAIP